MTLSSKQRVLRLAKVLQCGEPLSSYAIGCVYYDRKWWLVGFAGGDQPLPRTYGLATINEALDAAEAWLAPEIDRYGDR